MEKRIKVQIWLFILLSVILMLSCIQVGFAKDNLVVTGIVRSVDPGSGILRINVTSEGCTGIREFKVPENGAADIDATLIGKRVQFYIDGAICERGKVHNILSERLP